LGAEAHGSGSTWAAQRLGEADRLAARRRSVGENHTRRAVRVGDAIEADPLLLAVRCGAHPPLAVIQRSGLRDDESPSCPALHRSDTASDAPRLNSLSGGTLRAVTAFARGKFSRFARNVPICPFLTLVRWSLYSARCAGGWAARSPARNDSCRRFGWKLAGEPGI
jgi:hypothetical protein